MSDLLEQQREVETLTEEIRGLTPGSSLRQMMMDKRIALIQALNVSLAELAEHDAKRQRAEFEQQKITDAKSINDAREKFAIAVPDETPDQALEAEFAKADQMLHNL